MAIKEYQKLSTGRYWMKVSSLWRGQGHLLLVVSSGFVENYKRFYFRDIQAVLLKPHNRREVWAFFFTFFLLFFLWLQFGLHHSPSTAPFGYSSDIYAGFTAVVFAVCLIVDLLLGPGCVCQLKTAIQTVELPIKRYPRAQKIMRQLMPLIEEAQRALAEPSGTAVPSPARAVSPSAVTSPFPAEAKGPFHPAAHAFLFGSLLLDAVLDAGRFLTQSFPYYLADWTVGMAAVVSLIVSLAWQARREAPRILKRLTTVVLAYILVSYFLGLIEGFSMVRQNPGVAGDPWSLMKAAAAQPPDANALAFVLSAFSVTMSGVLGLIGTLELMRGLKKAPARP